MNKVDETRNGDGGGGDGDDEWNPLKMCAQHVIARTGVHNDERF